MGQERRTILGLDTKRRVGEPPSWPAASHTTAAGAHMVGYVVVAGAEPVTHGWGEGAASAPHHEFFLRDNVHERPHVVGDELKAKQTVSWVALYGSEHKVWVCKKRFAHRMWGLKEQMNHWFYLLHVRSRILYTLVHSATTVATETIVLVGLRTVVILPGAICSIYF